MTTLDMTKNIVYMYTYEVISNANYAIIYLCHPGQKYFINFCAMSNCRCMGHLYNPHMKIRGKEKFRCCSKSPVTSLWAKKRQSPSLSCCGFRFGHSCSSGGLGFRDIELFNLALLAHQVWRILQTLELLSGKILISVYFPNIDIMQATLGSSPSHAWRSLVEG